MGGMNRVIAWSIGIITFLCILMAAKSCNDTSRSKVSKNTSDTQVDAEEHEAKMREYLGINDGPAPESHGSKKEVVLDEFGRPVINPKAPEAETPTDENGLEIQEAPREYVTDAEGNVIGYIVPLEGETEEGGNAEKEDKPSGMDISDYFQPATKSDISGYHDAPSNEDNGEIPTIPPDFVININ